MISIPDSVQEMLLNCLAVANTPSFVFRKFSESLTVQTIAANEPTQDVYAALKDQLDSEPFGTKNAVRGYAFLVALMLRAPSMADKAAKLPGFDRLLFGKSLVSLVTPKMATTFGEVKPQPQVHTLSEPASTLFIPGKHNDPD